MNHNFLVRLPKAKGSSGLLVNTLETDLPLFDHTLGDLKDKVEFKKLIMKTESKPMFVEVSVKFQLHTNAHGFYF